MQAQALNCRTAAFIPRKSARPSTRRSVTVTALQSADLKEMGKNAALVAATLALTLAPSADVQAAVKKTTAYQREQAYEQELFAALKARTGKSEVLPNLTSSPKDSVAPAKAAPALKFEGSIEKVKTEAPAAVPTPAPAVPAPAAAPKPAAAPASAAAVAAPAGDNKGVLAVVAIAVVGAAGLAAANNGGEGQLEAAGAPAAAAAPAAGSDLPPNVREARAWIAAWKKKHNNP